MKSILKKGHGIIITGPTKANKIVLAKVIAESIGFFAMADFEGINGLFNSVFLTGPDVLIVEEFDPTEVNLAKAKALVSDDKIVVERRGYDPQIVDLPCFIFVTNSEEQFNFLPNYHRFTVIRIGG